MRRHFFALQYILVFLFFCHCATKHQPTAFEPRFSLVPEEYLSSEVLGSIAELEGRETLSALEKKRLYDLYAVEVRGLKIQSPRFQAVSERAEKLRPEIESLQNDVGRLRSELSSAQSPEVPKNPFEKPALKKMWTDVYQLWNKDENDRALEKLDVLLKDPALTGEVTDPERMKLVNLRFRIASDLLNREVMKSSYESMLKIDACAPETAQAGFLMAIYAFIDKDLPRARQLFQEQCDRDDSLSNQLKRAYWNYRFSGKEGEEKALKELKALPMPGYYSYLASAIRNESFTLQTKPKNPPRYLASEFKIDSSVKELIVSAEERLKMGLRKDASSYLGKAVLLMKDKPENNVFPLLYTAHLFRAAGNHLESMKIYSLVSSSKEIEHSEIASIFEEELPTLFPKPFGSYVDLSTRDWQVDPDFVYSIMRQESAFNPGATSSADARGLMQLMPTLGKFLVEQWRSKRVFNEKALYNGSENIKLAVFHLHQLKTLAPHPALMAASYNAGINRTTVWWKRFGNLPLDVFVELIPVTETRNYVKLVLRNYLYYKALRTGGEVKPDFIPLELPGFGGEVNSPKA